MASNMYEGSVPPAPPPPPLYLPAGVQKGMSTQTTQTTQPNLQSGLGTGGQPGFIQQAPLQGSSVLGNTGLVNQPGLFPGQGQGQGQQMGYGHVQTGASSAQAYPMQSQMGQGEFRTVVQPVETQTVQREPVVMETISEMERDVVKPIIHRERQQTEIRRITQPYIEKQVKPEIIEERVLPAETRAPIIQSAPEELVRQYQTQRMSTVNIRPKVVTAVEEQPLVLEEVKRLIREEVQPVIYREVIQPTVIRETKHVYEKIVEAPKIFEETRTLLPLAQLRNWNLAGQGMPQQFAGQERGFNQIQQPVQFVQQPVQFVQQQPMQAPIMMREEKFMSQPMQPAGQGLFLNRDHVEVERYQRPIYPGGVVPIQDVRTNYFSESRPLYQ